MLHKTISLTQSVNHGQPSQQAERTFVLRMGVQTGGDKPAIMLGTYTSKA